MSQKFFIAISSISLVLITAILFLIVNPFTKPSWGALSFTTSPSISVYGSASSQEASQIATFDAGIYLTKENKEEAINEVNQKIENIIAKLIDFGIAEADIKTQNLSIYQRQEDYSGTGKEGYWDVSNNLSIKLRDITKASELTVLLSNEGATNIYGPNFTSGDTKDIEKELLVEAIEDAKAKASLAIGNGEKLGKVISIIESGAISGENPFLYREMGAGGSGITPGSQEITKTVSVTFELK